MKYKYFNIFWYASGKTKFLKNQFKILLQDSILIFQYCEFHIPFLYEKETLFTIIIYLIRIGLRYPENNSPKGLYNSGRQVTKTI